MTAFKLEAFELFREKPTAIQAGGKNEGQRRGKEEMKGDGDRG